MCAPAVILGPELTSLVTADGDFCVFWGSIEDEQNRAATYLV